jgi:hypothetical protein
MPDAVKAFVWLVMAVLMGLVSVFQTYRLGAAKDAAAQATLELSEARRVAQEELAKAQSQVRKVEEDLQTKAAEVRKETHDQISALGAQRDALLVRVRRAEAATTAPVRMPEASSFTCTGTLAPGDSGAELLGSIGQEDVEEASRADLLRIHLKSCYEHYENARKLLNVLNR